jgi:hypothetical protein
MANLIPCIACGKSVSRQATTCPHCGNSDAQGVKCFVCANRLSKQAAATFTFGPDDYPKYFHPQCLSSLVREYYAPSGQLHCRDCGATLDSVPSLEDRSWAEGYAEKTCPKCGCPNPFKTRTWPKSQCSYCLKPIYKFQPIRRKDGGTDYYYYHIPCCQIKSGRETFANSIIEFIDKIKPWY